MSLDAPQGLTPDQIRWHERYQALEAESLPSIRATAKQWFAAIGTLTGVFGLVALVKGPEDLGALGGWTGGVAIFLTLAALLFALGAIVCAALASQGSPEQLGYRAGRWPKFWRRCSGLRGLPDTLPTSSVGLRAYYNVEAWVARWQLGLSRILVVVAVLSMIAAVGTTWAFSPKDPSTAKVLVVKSDGSFACGDLSPGKANTVNVLAKKGAMPTEIKVADILAVHSAATCP